MPLSFAARVDGRLFSLAHSRGREALTKQIQEIKKVPFQISLSFPFSLTTQTLPIQTRVSLKTLISALCKTLSNGVGDYFGYFHEPGQQAVTLSEEGSKLSAICQQISCI